MPARKLLSTLSWSLALALFSACDAPDEPDTSPPPDGPEDFADDPDDEPGEDPVDEDSLGVPPDGPPPDDLRDRPDEDEPGSPAGLRAPTSRR